MSPEETQQHHRFIRALTAHEPALRAFIRRLVPSRADADDIMQEVSVVLWEKFHLLEDPDHFKPWAFGVARYEVLGWLRDQGRDRLVLDEKVVEQLARDSIADEPKLSRQREALDHCMQKVAPEQRRLLMQAYQPDQHIHDIAKQSGRTVPGLYQWLHRMRKKLLECIRRTLTQELSS